MSGGVQRIKILIRKTLYASAYCGCLDCGNSVRRKVCHPGVSYVVILAVKSNYLIWASFFPVSCFCISSDPSRHGNPSLIKYATRNLTENGRTVGTLEACGTVGSILGTFLPTLLRSRTSEQQQLFIFCRHSGLCPCFILFQQRSILRGAAVTGIIIVLIFAPVNYSFAFWEKRPCLMKGVHL